jgi:hypothetical protein
MAKHRLKVNNYAKLITFLVIIISLVVLGVGLVLFNESESSLEESFSPINIDDDMQYIILHDNYVTLKGNILNLIEYNKEGSVYSKQVSSDDLTLAASDRLIVVHNNKNIQALSIEGDYLYSIDVIGTIRNVKCGKNVIAVFSEIIDENGKVENMIYFYNTSGSLFDSISFAPQYIIDYDFLDSGDIWILTTDPGSAVPVSRIITYKPGVSMTGLSNLHSEIAYRVFFTDENMYVATTNNLIKFNHFGNKLDSSVIYDWDIKTQSLSTEDPCFVAVPRSQNKEAYFVNGKIVYENYYYKINFPVRVNNMLMNKNLLYLFAEDIIYIYTAKGKYQRQYALDSSIEYIEFIKDNIILVKKDEAYMMLTLP